MRLNCIKNTTKEPLITEQEPLILKVNIGLCIKNADEYEKC